MTRSSHTGAGVSPGAIPSPNIWNHPGTYELENRSVDPDGVIESVMRRIRPYDGSVLLDVGCGTGYHLPRFAESAASVIGVEPHPALVLGARHRTAGLPNVDVRHGSAQALPVASSSVDVVHARWAYFFGSGCEPGFAEIDRVIRRGGAAFVIDNDASTSTFGEWFRWAHPDYDTAAVDGFFARHGWSNHHTMMRWSFATRDELEAVIRIEFSPEVADRILGGHVGTEVDYAIVIRHRVVSTQ